MPSVQYDRVIQSRINQSVRAVEDAIQVLDAQISSGTDASLAAATQVGLYAYHDNSGWYRLTCDASGHLDINIDQEGLLATSANQTLEITKLGDICGGLDTLNTNVVICDTNNVTIAGGAVEISGSVTEANSASILSKLGDICVNTASITFDKTGLATDTLQTDIYNRLDPSVTLSINDSVYSTINYVGNVAAATTYTSSAELSRLSDVGMFCKATGAGTLKFQFSYDNSDWSTFPVNGFSMAANVPEFHTAVKLPRWFRYQFENTAGVDVSLNAYAYYSQNFRQGSLPLNADIGSDNDALVVRAVNVGEQPDGTYSNIKADGAGFRTTTNLGGTTLNESILGDSSLGNIKVGDTSSFGASGYIYIDTEYLEYDSVVDASTLNIVTRGSFGSPADVHATTGVPVGEAYATGILTLDGYTEVATKLLSSNNGQSKFRWFADSAGTDPIRTLNPAYSKTTGYEYLAAPNFGPYVQYVHANTQDSATTDFYFETEFYTKAISAQVLTLNSTVLGGMTANLGKNVAVGKTRGGSYGNVGITSTVAGREALKVAIREPLTAFGELRATQATPEVQLSFVHNQINPLLVNTDTSGAGASVTAANALYVVACDAKADTYAQLASKRYLKYRTGQGASFRGTAIFDTPATGNNQLVGAGTATNGFFFGYNDLSFGILRRSGGVDNWTYQADWNIDKMDGTGDSGFTLDPTLGNVYQISYQWLGFGAVTFAIEGQYGEISPVHIIDYAGTAIVPTVENPSFPIIVRSENSTNTTAVTIKGASLAGFNEGSVATLGAPFAIEETATTGITTESPILSIKVGTTLNSVDAYIPVLPQELTIVGEGTGSNVVRFGLYLDADISGAVWTAVDASYSVVDYDNTAASITNGTKIGSYVVERNRGQLINLKAKELQLTRNQTLTVTASSASSVDPDVAIVWIENDSG